MVLNVALAEYAAIESEKRIVAQALLAVTGLVVVAAAAIAGAVSAANLLPLMLLSPATLVGAWAGAVLKAYADEYVNYLAVLEDQMGVITRAPRPVMGWNTFWSTGHKKARRLGTDRSASILPLLTAALIGAGLSIGVGVYAIHHSHVLDPLPYLAAMAIQGSYVVFNVVLAGMVLLTWKRGQHRQAASTKAFRTYFGLPVEVDMVSQKSLEDRRQELLKATKDARVLLRWAEIIPAAIITAVGAVLGALFFFWTEPTARAVLTGALIAAIPVATWWAQQLGAHRTQRVTALARIRTLARQAAVVGVEDAAQLVIEGEELLCAWFGRKEHCEHDDED